MFQNITFSFLINAALKLLHKKHYKSFWSQSYEHPVVCLGTTQPMQLVPLDPRGTRNAIFTDGNWEPIFWTGA